MSGNIPYIGSKISLITTADIRYEGILYTLNREESTIAVQNVRSFGTEGRRCPEVPMSNEIYDFIIFRGKDLKDLTVLAGAPEPAAPYPAAGGNDYMESHSNSMYGAPVPPPADHQSSMNSYQRPSMGSTAASRNGFQPAAHVPSAPMPKSYSGGYVSPTSSASRPAERSFSGGMPQRQPYAPDQMQQAAMSSPPVRSPMPMYEDQSSQQAQRVNSNDLGKGGMSREKSEDDKFDQSDAKGRGKGKSAAQKKSLYEVLRFHKRAEELIVKMMRGQSSANVGPGELRAMSEMNPSVYHFYLDFVNYCCPSHTIQSDEQQWETLCKALKKHFEKEFGSANQNQKPAQPQRPNNTLGDFITIQTDTKSAKKAGAKAPRGGGRVGRGGGRGDKKDSGSGDWDGIEEEAPARESTWICPRCTLRNESLLSECAACGFPKQQAALWGEFPPLK